VFALTLAKEMLAEYTGTPFHPILRSALEKIQERLPARVQLEVGDVEAAIEFGRMPMLPFSKKMFLDLHRACEKRLQTQIEYKSASKGELTDRSVNPCKLLAHQNSWYLVAYCNLRKDLRLFALHRIQEYAVGATTFESVDKEVLDGWLKSPLFLEHQDQPVDVVIKFGPRSTRYVKEKVWHPTQQLSEHEDGSSTLAFTTSSIDEVKRWVLTYADDAEVISPASLRSAIASALRSAASKYSGCKSID
jgi:predicted DNA-binding transcriptional regulator YafY